jgi:hypothetical protein
MARVCDGIAMLWEKRSFGKSSGDGAKTGDEVWDRSARAAGGALRRHWLGQIRRITGISRTPK